jgi:hypothetical protein
MRTKKAARQRRPRAVVEIGAAHHRVVRRLAKEQKRTQKQVLMAAIDREADAHKAEQKRMKGFEEALG